MALDVVFVCSGNTCRSPMAEMIFDHLMKRKGLQRDVDYRVRSAGTDALADQPAADAAIRTLERHRIDVKHHRSSPFGPRHTEADLILTMTRDHKDTLLERYPDLQGKVHTLNDFAQTGDSDIYDPYMQGDEAYGDAFNEIHRAVADLVERLTDEGS